MELKHKIKPFSEYAGILLIVPYGIETLIIQLVLSAAVMLLIVPYGIET